MEEQVRQGVEILKKGGIVAFPTDTLYGIGAHAYREEAVKRVFAAKNRPSLTPLPLLLADVENLEEVASDIPSVAWQLIDRFLPGALTLVLKRSSRVSDVVTAGSESVAVRIPNHPTPLALIRGLGAPITGTSANISGGPDPLTAEDVRRQMGYKVDLIIDGGRCSGGIGSTVLDLTGPSPVIRREGAIAREAIEEVCGTVVVV